MFRKLSIFPIMAIILSLFFTACEPTYGLNLEADPEEGGMVTGSGSFRQGEEVTFLAEPEEGYEFEHWVLEDGEILSTDNKHTLKIEEHREIKGVFSRKSYRVSLTSDIDGVSLNGAGFYEHGEEAEITVLENNNSTFVIWIEDGKIGLLSESGQVIEKPVFENLRLPGPMEYGGHADRNFVAEEYAALKKDGLWAFFKDGTFLTDFKFEEIPGRFNRPMIYNEIVQVIVEEDRDKTAGLYDLEKDEYIIPQGEYDEIDYLKEGRILVKHDGKYGYVDQNNRPVTAIKYDKATAFENEAAAAIKDDRLLILDKGGNNFVEPLEINPEDYTDNIPGANLLLTYLEGPEIYRTERLGHAGFSYFDQDGWIRKHD